MSRSDGYTGDGKLHKADAPQASYDRSTVAFALARDIDRRKLLFALVIYVSIYCLLVSAFIFHTHVPQANEVELGLRQALHESISSSSEVAHGLDDIYAWLANVHIPEVLPAQRDNSSLPSVGHRLQLMGGLRVSQSRGVQSACTWGGPGAALAATTCVSSTTISLAAYGDTRIPACAPVASAFAPNLYARHHSDVNTVDVFQSVMPDRLVAGDVTSALAACGWLDQASLTVHATSAYYVPHSGRWATAAFTFTLTEGGLIERSYTVDSHPWDGYSPEWASVTTGLDVAVVFCVLGLAFETVVRLLSILVFAATKRSCTSGVQAIVHADVIIDAACVCSLVATCTLWSEYMSALASARSVAAASFTSPTSGDSDATLALHVALIDASVEEVRFKTAGVVAVCLLTLKLILVLSLQPRLGAFGRSILQALSDMAHCAAAFALLLTAYGVWGHVIFGSQTADWRTVGSSADAILRLMMYDYDLLAMNQVDATSAGIFFGSFMFIVTNLAFWMFLAIAMDAFALARAEARACPDGYTDIIRSAVDAPSTAQAAVASLMSRRRGMCSQPSLPLLGSADGRTGPQAGARVGKQTLTSSMVLEHLKCLPPGEHVAIEDVASSLHCSHAEVAAVIQNALDANSTSEVDPTVLTIDLLRAAMRSARAGWLALAARGPRPQLDTQTAAHSHAHSQEPSLMPILHSPTATGAARRASHVGSLDRSQETHTPLAVHSPLPQPTWHDDGSFLHTSQLTGSGGGGGGAPPLSDQQSIAAEVLALHARPRAPSLPFSHTSSSGPPPVTLSVQHHVEQEGMSPTGLDSGISTLPVSGGLGSEERLQRIERMLTVMMERLSPQAATR